MTLRSLLGLIDLQRADFWVKIDFFLVSHGLLSCYRHNPEFQIHSGNLALTSIYNQIDAFFFQKPDMAKFLPHWKSFSADCTNPIATKFMPNKGFCFQRLKDSSSLFIECLCCRIREKYNDQDLFFSILKL